MGNAVGCLGLIILWIGSSYWYWNYLGQISGDYKLLGIALGFGVMVVGGNFWALITSIRRWRISARSSSSWEDGNLVALSGKIRPEREAITGPASGTRAVIVEYEVQRKVVSGTGGSRQVSHRKDVWGFLMVPCSIQGKQGTLRLHGFPDMNRFSSKQHSASEDFRRFGTFFSNATVESMGLDPRAIFRSISDVFNDIDGDVQKNFIQSDSPLLLNEFDSNEQSDITHEGTPAIEEDERDDREWNKDRHGTSTPAKVAEVLSEHDFYITERLIQVGEEVTVFGTYKKSARAIDVSGGIGSGMHSMHQGELSRTVWRGIIFTFIWFDIWCVILLVGNYLAVPDFRKWVISLGVDRYAPEVVQFLDGYLLIR